MRYVRFLDGGGGGGRGDAAPAAAAVMTASADRRVQRWAVAADARQSGEGGAGGDAAEVLAAAVGTRLKSFDTSPDGSLAVVLLWDSSVSVWDLTTGQRVRVRPASPPLSPPTPLFIARARLTLCGCCRGSCTESARGV